MKAFNEKCDMILHFLANQQWVSWEKFRDNTGLKKGDALVSFLKKEKGFIESNNDKINITVKGKDFISRTSFVLQRDNQLAAGAR